MRRMLRSRTTFATIEAAAIAALFSSPSTTARGGGDGVSLLFAAADRSVRRRGRAEAEAVDEADLCGRVQGSERRPESRQVRAVEPVAVDRAGRDHAHDDLLRAIEDRTEQLFPRFG